MESTIILYQNNHQHLCNPSTKPFEKINLKINLKDQTIEIIKIINNLCIICTFGITPLRGVTRGATYGCSCKCRVHRTLESLNKTL